MARSDHLPIYKATYDLCLWFEQLVNRLVVHSEPVPPSYAWAGYFRDGLTFDTFRGKTDPEFVRAVRAGS